MLPILNIYNYEIITTNFYYELDILVQLKEAANLCTVMQLFSIWLNVSMELDITIFDIMFGGHTIFYSIKDRNKLVTNNSAFKKLFLYLAKKQ